MEKGTKIEVITEFLLEQLFEQHLLDLSTCLDNTTTNTTAPVHANNNQTSSFQHTILPPNDNRNGPRVDNNKTCTFPSDILINEEGLKVKIILFKKVFASSDNSFQTHCNRDNRVGIMIAFLTEGFYGCELISIFDTGHTVYSLKNKIQSSTVVELLESGFSNHSKTHSTIQSSPPPPPPLQQQQHDHNCEEENYILNAIFSELIEPLADTVIPFYNRLFSYCKTSNLLLRNNSILASSRTTQPSSNFGLVQSDCGVYSDGHGHDENDRSLATTVIEGYFLFHNQCSPPIVSQYLNPTTCKSSIFIVKKLKQEEYVEIQNRGLTRFLIEEGFNNEIFPIKYWNSISFNSITTSDQTFSQLRTSTTQLVNNPTYKDHFKKAQQLFQVKQHDFYTLSQLEGDNYNNSNIDTTNYSSSFFKINSDLFSQPITVSLFSTNYGSTTAVTDNSIQKVVIDMIIPVGMHDLLVRSLYEMDTNYYQYYSGILIRCGVHNGVSGHLLENGTIFSNTSSGKCVYWAFSECRFDWCLDLLSDEMEIQNDTLIVKCCPKTMEDVLSCLYYQQDMSLKEERSLTFSCSKSNNPSPPTTVFTISWSKNRSFIYYYQVGDLSNPPIPIDAEIFCLHGTEFLDVEEFKYNYHHHHHLHATTKSHGDSEDYYQISIEQIILLSPPIQFSTRINANNMVKLVKFIFKMFVNVLTKNPTLPFEVIERFDLVVNCLDHGYVVFDLNSYYDKNGNHSKLKKEWVDKHLNVRKVLKEFISNGQLLSFIGPKLSFCLHFQIVAAN